MGIYKSYQSRELLELVTSEMNGLKGKGKLTRKMHNTHVKVAGTVVMEKTLDVHCYAIIVDESQNVAKVVLKMNYERFLSFYDVHNVGAESLFSITSTKGSNVKPLEIVTYAGITLARKH